MAEDSLTLQPRFRRVVAGVFHRRQYDPVVIGTSDSDVRLQVFVNPFSDACTKFFDDTYDRLNKALIADNSIPDLAIEIRPIAPEMRMWTTAAAADIKHIVGGDEALSAPVIAESLHSIRDRAGDEAFISSTQRFCLVANEVLTTDKLVRIADDVGIEPDAVVRDVERGTYRTRVRRDSEQWIRAVANRFGAEAPTEATVFLNGELVHDVEPEPMVERVRSVHSVNDINTELGSSPDGEHEE